MPYEDLAPEIRLEKELEGRAKWRSGRYERELLLTLEITDQCTLECAHCFASSSPRNNTFLEARLVEQLAGDSVELFRRYPVNEFAIIDALERGKKPEEIEGMTSSHIRITGGDPFLHPEMHAIINSFARRKKELGSPLIDVETNGWWAVDDGKTREVIEALKDSGASCLSMTLDYWHMQNSPFPNSEHGERIEKIAKEGKLKFRFITPDFPLNWSITMIGGMLDWIPQATPVGRARDLDKKYWGEPGSHHSNYDECRLSPSPFMATLWYVHEDEFTIGPQGNVYACNSGRQFDNATLALGNLHQKGILQIIKEDANPIVRLLRERGTRGLTEPAGLSLAEHYRMYDEMTPCGLCHEMLRGQGKAL